jgi:ATP-dependent helicase/nuclease subunit A
MPERWTPDQRLAIETLDRDVLVTASPGTGKTAVMVAHALEILRRGIPPERLVAITFTRKAADQLRQRLFDALASAPEPRLRALIPLLPRAYISTIHGFCQRILREAAAEAGVDPGFRILDETASDLLLAESVRQVLDRWFEARRAGGGDDLFGRLVELASVQTDGIEGLLREAVRMVRTTENPRRTLDGLARHNALPYRRLFRTLLEETWSDLQRTSEALLAGLEAAARLTPSAGRLLQALGRFLEIQPSWRRFRQLWELRRTLQERELVDEDGRCRVTRIHLPEELKPLYRRWQELWKALPLFWLPESPDDLRSHERQVAAFGKTLSALLHEILETYGEAKERRGALDFADLELRAAAYLEKGPRLPTHEFEHVLVDEFQDVNRLQARIIGSLAEDHRYFFVGDVKQCIYEFRLSSPEIFRSLMEEHEPVRDAAAVLQGQSAPPAGRRVGVGLRASFRSRPPVLDFVNAVFRHVFRRETTGLPYEGQELVPGLDWSSAPEHPPVEIHLVTEGPEESPPGTRRRTAAEREAMLVARRIRRLVEEERPRIWDRARDTWRPVGYGDVAVLLRSPGLRWGQTFLRVLRSQGIPAHLGRGTGFFEAEEIRDALDLLRVLDNALDDIPLAALLRSPILGWSDDDLALLRHAFPEARYLWLALEEMAGAPEAEAGVRETLVGRRRELPAEMAERLRRRSAEAVATIRAWRGRIHAGELPESLGAVLQEAGLPLLAAAHPEGNLRQANLHRLLDLAGQYAGEHGHSLRGFLAWLDAVRVESGQLPQVPSQAEEGDAVRILSVHLAKGLEFPVVVVAQLGQKLRLGPQREGILVTPQGLGMDLLEPRRFVRIPTVAGRTLAAVRHRADAFEEMRILYVAMTRARDRLLLVGTTRKPVPETRPPLTGRDLWHPRGQNALDGWLLPVLSEQPCWRAVAEGEREAFQEGPPALRVRLHAPEALDRAFPSHPPEPRPSPTREAIRTERMEVEVRGSRLEPILEPVRRRYPWPWLRRIQGRYWVTELKRATQAWAREEAAEEGVVLPEVPSLEEPAWPPVLLGGEIQDAASPPDARALGSAVHLVLQRLDLDRVLALREVDAERLAPLVEEIRRRHDLPAQVVEPEVLGWIASFFASTLGRSLLEAWERARDQVFREVPFTLRLPLRRLREILGEGGIPWPEEAHLEGDWTLLQGQMDLLWRDPGGGWMLVDYKTDRIASEGELAERVVIYRTQMEMYKQAAVTLWEARPLRAYLFFLQGERVVEVDGA